MRNNLRLGALLLIAATTFAQHRGTFRGSSPSGFGHITRPPGSRSLPRISAGFPRHRSAYGQQFGNGFFVPYYPFIGGYADVPMTDYLPGNDGFVFEPSASAIVSSAPPVQTAHPALHEYNWSHRAVAPAGEQTTFTIALKDGSKRFAVVSWVQNRTLHYIDSQDRQGVLSSDLIDRDTTRQLNKGKQLNIQLPPGC